MKVVVYDDLKLHVICLRCCCYWLVLIEKISIYSLSLSNSLPVSVWNYIYMYNIFQFKLLNQLGILLKLIRFFDISIFLFVVSPFFLCLSSFLSLCIWIITDCCSCCCLLWCYVQNVSNMYFVLCACVWACLCVSVLLLQGLRSCRSFLSMNDARAENENWIQNNKIYLLSLLFIGQDPLLLLTS